jgi:membrane associated rhomboid family serine protease
MYLILILILIYSVSRVADVTFLAAAKGCEPWQYVSFHFVHVSFLHLAVNALAIYLYWRVIRQTANVKYAIPVIAAAAAAAGCLSLEETPTAGASAIAFSMIAVYCVWLFLKKGVKDRKAVKMYIMQAAAMGIQGLFYTGINTKMHLAAFLAAALLSFLFRRKLYGL